MVRVEFHCHTIFSKDSLTSPEMLVEACQRRGIDRVVVTDHNTIDGALRAREIDPSRVIVGEEIMTQEGELLAAFVKEEVPAGLTPMETIDRLRAQGAFISVSHPFDRMRKGHWSRNALLKIIEHVDAIETYNARCLWPGYNREAKAFAQQHRLCGTAGSDAHTPGELGRANLILPPFEDAAGLKAALDQAQARLYSLPPWVHFYSRYAVWRKKMGGNQQP